MLGEGPSTRSTSADASCARESAFGMTPPTALIRRHTLHPAALIAPAILLAASAHAYIALKMDEVTRFRMTTHPVEFDMYYSL